jgi:DNA-binding winged helix-turn-helix (wHTH) protein/tetratricopeptide (TPR) repeat protein
MGQAGHLQFRFDAFELDEADARLKRDGRPVALAPKAFGVLCELARKPGVLVTKNALLDAVWGHQHVSESVLKTTISQVRAALADDAANPRYIETASRLGYRFVGAAAPKPASPVAAPAGAIPDSFIGRRAALDRLQDAWVRAVNGQRQLLWVAGDAGVGKSTLLETFVRQSGAAGIGQGQCVEQYGSGEPYLPVLQALGDLCREYSELGPLMRAAAPTWLLQIPWLVAESERGALARELVGISPERMVREFHELIVRFSEKRPLLFILEDLHWSDEATLRLMNHFARQRTPARVLWIGSFRLTQVIAEAHPLQALRQELRLHKLCEEIVLDPFSEAEVQEYLRGRAPPAQVPEAFIRRVHAHTDGLPLFVANVVDALLGADAAFTGNSPLPVPEDLMGAVETRIGKLPAQAIALLEAAAVIGVEFRAGAVAEVIGRDLASVIEVCDQFAKQQYWLRHVGTVDLADGTLDATYAFKHAIYRHVFYHRLGAAPRVQLHRRSAQVLAAGAAKGVPVAPAELASHHERGREPAAALSAYSQAAHAALRSFAPTQALELCEHASSLLTLIPAGPERLALEFALQGPRGVATAQIHGIGSAEARVVFERVHEICNQLPMHPARAIALNGYGASLYTRGEYQKLLDLADRMDALEKGPDSPALTVMTCLFRGGVTLARGQARESIGWWRKAITWCESITDRTKFPAFILDPECGIRSNSIRAFYQCGLFDEARKQSALALEISQRVGQPMAQVLAHWRSGMLEVRLGRPEKVLEHADRITSVVAKTTLAQGDGPSRYLRGWAEAQLGNARAGFEMIRDGLERHLRIGMIANSTEVLAYAAEALILAGDYDGAATQLAEAFARSRELDEQDYLPVLLLLQARVAQGKGDAAAAYQWLGEGVRIARAQESAGMELKVSCARAEHPLATEEDRSKLAALVQGLTEGHDIADMQRARGLMGAATH